MTPLPPRNTGQYSEYTIWQQNLDNRETVRNRDLDIFTRFWRIYDIEKIQFTLFRDYLKNQ